MENLLGKTLGQYRIIAKIGQGAMASVFKAYQPSLDRYVALKVLPTSFAAENPIFIERFQREARAIAKLHHPNILPVYDFGIDKDYSYIVMRYVEGAQTLVHVMAQSLTYERMVDLLGQVAEALDYAHSHNIIHRDVKPSNILVDSRWVLLSDFGLVKILGAKTHLTETGSSIGTPAYTSPEQAKGLVVDHRTDIYALGVILYEMLTGTIPHNDPTPLTILLKRITEPPIPPRTLNPNIPENVEQVILRAIDPYPEKRYNQATDMIAALKLAMVDGTLLEPLVKGSSKGTTMGTVPFAPAADSQEDRPENKQTLVLPNLEPAAAKKRILPYGLLLAAVAGIALIIMAGIFWNRNIPGLAEAPAEPDLTAPVTAAATTPATISPEEAPVLPTATPIPTPVVVKFSVNPAAITEGESVTIEWEVTGADQVSIEPIGNNLPLARSLVQWPAQTTFYALNASNGSAKIEPIFQQVVVKPVPTNTPTLPTPTPTATIVLEVTATATLTPSVTPSPPPTAIPTFTPTATPALPDGTFASLHILNPDNLSFGPTDFVWDWYGPKPAGTGFEIRVWREGEPQLGAHDALLDYQRGRVRQVAENSYRLNIDISQAAGVRNRTGEYLWTVVLIQTDPEYADLGIQAEPSTLRFAASGSGGGSGDGGSGSSSGGIE
jgi:tRNA A-37 threonylcarbamoyl transferase component Bud32